jgi:hypothetical protein
LQSWYPICRIFLARCDRIDPRLRKGEITVKELVLSSLLVLSLLANPMTLSGQTPAQGVAGKWETVKLVPVGSELVVKLKDGKTVKARHAGTTDTTVTVSRNRSLMDIQRSAIHQVSIRVKTDKDKAQAIGAGVGAATLSLTSLGGLTEVESGGEAVLFLISVALIGAAIGYVIGSLVGRARKTVLIYEASN